MEFLRFGSSIPGSYWGCCAIDIIQNFKVDPDEKAAIEIVCGDSNISHNKYIGLTYREIFLQRLRFGTFGAGEMHNHAFIATLTDWQVNSNPGKKWLKLLHETGFEFVRAVANSVHTGSNPLHKGKVKDVDLDEDDCDDDDTGVNKWNGSLNYIFMLVRNTAQGAAKDPFQPPAAWKELRKDTDLPEVWKLLGDTTKVSKDLRERQIEYLEKLPKPVFLTKSEIPTDVPLWKAGRRPKDEPGNLQMVEGYGTKGAKAESHSKDTPSSKIMKGVAA